MSDELFMARKPLRVLLGHNFYRSSAPSGEDAVFRNERALLESHGVEVISFERRNDDIDDSGLYRKLRLAAATCWSNATARAVSEVVRKYRPDIAHFHNTFPQLSPSVYASCTKNGVPVIQTLHNYRLICPGALLQRAGRPCEDCIGGSLMPALRHRCYRNSLAATGTLVGMISLNRRLGSYERNVTRYIALTQFAASRLVAGGLPAERMAVKPNFLPDPPAPGRGAGGYAVYVGRLSPEKGVRTMLNAWKKIDVPLKILGDGPIRAEMESLAREKHLPVEFMGFRSRDEILEIVCNAMFQVVPSEWYEGFPMVILEAYACGTPVVASRIGSLQEIVRENVTGSLFAPGDADDLAASIKGILGNGNRLEELRRTVRSYFEDHYTPRRNIDQLLAIYEEARENA